MKTKVTLRIDAELLREAKALAARRGVSLGRLIGMELEEWVRNEREFGRAQDRALRRLDEGSPLQWTPPASRAELHER